MMVEVAVSSLTLWLTAAFFPQISIYSANHGELKTPLRYLIGAGLALSVAGVIVWTALLALVPERFAPLGVALTLGAAIAATVQANLLVRDYGALDGRPIQWSQHRFRGVLDVGLWLAVLAPSVWFADVLNAHCLWVGPAVIGLNALNLVGLRRPLSEQGRRQTTYVPSAATMFAFSKEKNAILLVSDSFRSDVFEEIIAERPDIKDALDGFIFFPDTASSFPSTNFSIPVMLTGREYDNSIKYKKYLKESFKSTSSIPHVLRSHGYLTDGHTACLQTIHTGPEAFSNFIPFQSIFDADLREIAQLIDLALFRALPQPLKAIVYRNQKWLFVNGFAQGSGGSGADKAYYMPWPKTEKYFGAKAQAEITTDLDKPAFKFYHLYGAHVPYWMDERGQELAEAVADTPENYKRQAVGCLVHLIEFLRLLKQCGVYDNTIIVVAGDHGYDFNAPAPKRPRDEVEDAERFLRATTDAESGGAHAMEAGPADGEAGNAFGAAPAPAVAETAGAQEDARKDGTKPEEEANTLLNPLLVKVPAGDVLKNLGNPLLLVKPIGASGPLATDLRPAALKDIPATVFGQLKVAARPDQGTDLTAAGRPSVDRRFYYIARSGTWDTDVWGPELHEVLVQGSARDAESWRPTDRVLRPRLDGEGCYDLDTVVVPARMGAFAGTIVSGVHQPEYEWSWTAGSIHLIFNLAPAVADDLLFVADLEAVYHDRLTFVISGDGLAPQESSITGREVVELALPRSRSDGNAVRVSIVLSDPVVTSEAFHFNKTLREIGARIRRWALCSANSGQRRATLWRQEIADERNGPQALSFTSGAKGIAALASGWAQPGSQFTWSNARSPVLKLALPEKTEADDWVRLRVYLSGLFVPGVIDSQRVTVVVNGTVCVEWKVQHPGWYEALLPPHILTDGTSTIRFVLPDAASQADLCIGTSGSLLGLQLYELTCTNAHPLAAGEIDGFSMDDATISIRASGWRPPEAGFTWSLGSTANLVVPICPPPSAETRLRLGLLLTPLQHAGRVARQRIKVSANGVPVTELLVVSSGWYWIALPSGAADDRLLRLTFDFLDAMPLSSFIETSDSSVLSVQLKGLTYRLEQESADAGAKGIEQFTPQAP